MPAPAYLGEFEHIVLLAVLRSLKDTSEPTAGRKENLPASTAVQELPAFPK